MSVDVRIENLRTQAPVMRPQLQQAIRLLGLNNLELKHFLEQAIVENPILEFADFGGVRKSFNLDDGLLLDAPQNSLVARVCTARFKNTVATELDISAFRKINVRGRADSAADVDYLETYGNQSIKDSDRTIGQEVSFQNLQISDWFGSDGSLFESNLAKTAAEQSLIRKKSLKDHVLEQMTIFLKEPCLQSIGRELIENLDESGYLIEDTASIAEQLGNDKETVDLVLYEMQKLDPPGIFARDLAECLALQLSEKNRLDPAMQALVNNLNAVVKFDISQICEVSAVSPRDAIDMIAELKALNPKPGLSFGHEVAASVVPDVFVTKKADGGWNVELNSDNLPQLLVSRRYYTQVEKLSGTKDDKAYIQSCLKSANWLIRSLDQRAQTILSVASELVRQQDGFLEQGVQGLRPLNLRNIAEIVGVHESTVSRVVSNKYMATPRGIFELRYFFTSALPASVGGEKHSSEAVRDKLRDLIGEEEATAVLSDDELVDILRRNGIGIARRTVAKYRESMGIPSSVKRRRARRMEVLGNC